MAAIGGGLGGLRGLLDDQSLVAFEVGTRNFLAIEQPLADFVLADRDDGFLDFERLRDGVLVVDHGPGRVVTGADDEFGAVDVAAC